MKIIRFSIFFLLFLVSTNTFAQAPYATLRGNSVAFSPDGKTLASESGAAVLLWNATTGTLIHTLRHRDDVSSVVFSPDGKTIASGDYDGEVRVWNATTGTLIHTLEGPTRSVNSVAFSPDGKTLASESGAAVLLWNATTGTLIHTLEGPTRSVNSVAFSPDGKTIASGDDDGEVRVWDATTGTLIHTLQHGAPINSVAFSPDGKTLASESRFGTAVLWDATTGTLIRVLRDEVNSVVFSPDGKTLASGNDDNTVRLWDATTGATLTRYHRGVDSIAFSPDGKTLASGSGEDDTIRFWDIATGTSERIDLGSASSGSFSPDLQQFAAVVGRSIIRLWDFSSRVSVAPVTVVSPPIGDSVVIDINIVGVKDVRGYDLTIEYNGKALRYASHTLGDYLPGDVFAGPTIITPPDSPDNIEDINGDGVVDLKDLIWLMADVASDEERDSDFDLADAQYESFKPFRGTRISSDTSVSFSATSPAGVGNGDGTLATVTFEVLRRRASNFALSGTLSDNDGNRVPFVVSPGRVVTPPWDVNGDGSVDILDLSFVAARFGQQDQPKADVNEDGVVDIKDLIVVASGMPGAAAAPAAWHRGIESPPTRADVQEWLAQAQQLNLTDVSSQRGIFFLESLLVALVPQETLLLPNYPNPFNPETWIPYQLAEPGDVTLTIYDIQGRVVRDLDLGHQRAGMYRTRSRAAYWDGRNAHGEPVASGVYFYTLKAGDFTATRKMLIRK